jgi:hypothetical protein
MQMIWAVLQCHQVTREFTGLQFWGHMTIVKEMSLFMLTEQDSTELVNIICQVGEAELVAAAAKAEVKRLSNKFTAKKGVKLLTAQGSPTHIVQADQGGG